MGVAIPLGYVEDRSSGALVVDGSLRFDSSKSQYLTRTPSSSGNRKTFTWSYWVKRTNLSTDQMSLGTADASGNNGTYVYMISTDVLRIEDYSTSAVWRLDATQVFRDASAWYHILFAVDTTQTTNSNRVKLYINGVQVTAFSTATYPTLNYDCFMNSNTNPTSIGRTGAYNLIYSGFCISNVYFIDGQALDPSYFGYTDALTNTWRPKKFKPQATPNNGTTWSSAGNFSGNVRSQGDSYGPPKMFNGIIGNESTTGAVCFAPYSSDSTCTWTSPTTFTGLTSLRLYVDLSGTTGKLTVNGVDYSSLVTALSGGDGWITIPQSSLSTISFGYTGGLNSATGIAAVEVNGVTLLDSDTTNIGTNGFFLPFDGSAPIGQDQSGRGNNWTPVNFGGSNTLEKATGALPILNTDGGGKVARVGVRTDSSASSLVLALPLVGIKSDFSNAVNSGTSNKAITANSATASSSYSNFYGGSFYFNGSSNLTLDLSSVSLSSPYTVEFWWYKAGTQSGNHGHFCLNGANNQTIAYREVAATGTGANDFYIDLGGSFVPGIITQTISTGSWNHFAFVHEGSGVLKSYLNGVLQTTKSIGTSGTMGSTTSIGGGIGSYTGQFINGYVQDYRIYQGAKYTQNFIPASTDPDILPDTPSGVSYTSNLTQITDGAVAFGSGRVLTTTSSADFNFGTGDFTIEYFLYRNSLGSNDAALTNYSQVSSGYFICLHSNSTDAYLFLNGSTVTSGGTAEARKWIHYAYVRSGTTCTIYKDGISIASATSSAQAGATNVMNIGAYSDGSSFIDGFISNLHIVKGTALYTSNFTPPTGPISSVANTKLLCCKSNSSATAFDVSPGTITANGNAAATNFNPFTVNINTQRGKQSGYCTLNPTIGATQLGGSTAPTYADGNSKVSFNGAAPAAGTIGVISGKWYFEVLVNSAASNNNSTGFGIRNGLNAGAYTDFTGYFRGVRHNNSGNLTYSTSADTGTSAGAIMAAGEVYGLVYDVDNNYFALYKNGIILVSSSSSSLSGGTWFPYAFGDSSSGSHTFNFGQKPFKFPPPAGFQPLALANTPRPTIVRPDQYVGVSTWVGNYPSSTNVNIGWKPDFVWLKSRTNATANLLFDTVRGATYYLSSNATDAESNSPSTTLTSFNDNGFTVGNNSTANGGNMVAWAWKAGGNSNTYNINDVGYATASAAGLTAGTITPTGASVNTKSGFSIITYNGAGTNSALTSTISHGLTQSPTFMIVKARTGTNAADDWFVYHKSIGPTKRIRLNLTNAADTQTWMGDTEPTSSLITLNQGWYSVNYTGHTHILYAWHDVPGFSKFGTYTGNGSTGADGPFVWIGFRPKWIMFKCSSSSQGGNASWRIFDAVRNPYNIVAEQLQADFNDAAASGSNEFDFTSNGVKIRYNSSAYNASGATYIYAAFAETPTQNLYGAQANAR